MPLYPCPACQRHVKANEATCPFCSEDLPRRRSSPGLAAAALGAAVALTGCPDKDRAVVKYGAPPAPETPAPAPDDSPVATEPTAPADEPRAVAEYGAPPPRLEPGPEEPERAAPKYGAPPAPRTPPSKPDDSQ